jgi:hypothetical protein
MSEDRDKQAANLFDLRRIIGGLLLLYGAILTVVGAADSQAAVAHAAGLRINLIAGLGMLVLGTLFVVWALTRPLGDELAASSETERPEAGAQRPT